MIYIFVAVFLLLLALYYDFAKKKAGYKFWWIFMYLLLVAIAGLRYRVGSDTFAYEAFFEDENVYLSSLSLEDYFSFNWEPLFIFFMAIIKSTIDDFVFFQICHAVIVNAVVFWFIRRNTTNRFTVLFFYFIFLYVLLNMEMAREALAICLFLFSVKYLIARRWVAYYGISLVAFFFHYGAAIIFLFPFLYGTKLSTKNVTMLFIMGIASIGLMNFDNIISVFTILGIPSIVLIKLAKYSYLSEGLNPVGFLISIVGYVMFPLFIIKVNQKLLLNHPRFYKFCFIFFALAMVVISAPFLSRFFNYICLLALICLSDFLINMSKSRKLAVNTKVSLTVLVFSSVILWNCKYYFSDLSDVTGKIGTKKYLYWYPYASVFDKKINPDREKIRDYME